jgi:hypothetical protein
VRSWQNDVRAISDGTDVLGKMVCALVCALMCAPVAGVPVAQRISFSSDQPKVYEVLQACSFETVANNLAEASSGTSTLTMAKSILAR